MTGISSIRHTKSCVKNILECIKHDTTLESLTGQPFRLGVVNNNIWLRSGQYDENLHIVVYDKDLKKVKEVKCNDDSINTILQVSDRDVMVSSDEGLYLYNKDGEYQYKIIEGSFSDIATNGNMVIAVDFLQNSVIEMTLSQDRWNKVNLFKLDTKDRSLKTLHILKEDIFVCMHFDQKLHRYTKEGKLIQEYGTGQICNELGQFHSPSICGSDVNDSIIIADLSNSRFQILDNDDKWTEVKREEWKYPEDVLIIGENMYILHESDKDINLSKYSII